MGTYDTSFSGSLLLVGVVLCALLAGTDGWSSVVARLNHPERFNEQLISYKGAHRLPRYYELASEGYYTGAYQDIPSGDNESCTSAECLEMSSVREKRRVDPTFYGHPKTREQIWERNFAHVLIDNRQTMSLVTLLIKVILKYMHNCIPIVLYDTYVGSTENYILEALFREFPTTFVTGRIGPNCTLDNPEILQPSGSMCRSYILFLSDVMMARKVIGPQLTSRVVLIPRSSQWKLQEFLASKQSRDIINLLVIGESYSVDKRINNEQPYVLYTHELYVDGLGANRPQVLTSWIGNKFSRSSVNLFPPKLRHGFSGHRYTIMAAHQPPFVIKKLITDGVGNVQIRWEGVEIRMLQTLSRYLNFTFDIVEPSKPQLGSGDAVVDEIKRRQADIGLAGMYVTIERNIATEMSVAHSSDCAAFLTLMSSALPRYRAILGPFQWPVWVAIIFIYLLAIFPLAFSDKMTLRHLLGNWSEIENMFWYVFGTFTNSLTFQGENSWSNTKKTSTRMLIGIYWVFTIIITACYTGSIIAFITLPVEPERVDSVQQLNRGFYRVGTLDRGGWERWFANSSHVATNKLLKDLRYVRSVEEGIRNVTGAFLISYAFIGSKEELQFLIKSNFSYQFINKRYGLHVSRECFALYGVSLVFPPYAVHRDPINNAILYMQEAGIIAKLKREVLWNTMKTRDGRYREASVGESLRGPAPEERGLTLADTEGMFLLMLFGYVVALGVLISEWVGGCTNRCREIMQERSERLKAASSGVSSVPQSAGSATSARNGKPDQNGSSATPVNGRNEDGSDGRSSGASQHRSLSDCLSEVSANTMQDLYNGPDRRHSTIVYLEGQLMSEEEAQRSVARKAKHRHSLSSVMERQVGQLFKHRKSKANPPNRDPTMMRAEVSEELGEGTSRSTEGRKSIEAPFGERLLH
ncbi:ionotropic receptor 21a-like [Anopheles albimanus]|uniref:ionotropic receptor 21a-like n=1 Tax=Anopheles albimanus TaxID=7167 RepID=UPI00163DEEF8|nr:ionotropic receptor 21a-like [Anopheles albimanus]